MGLILPQIAVLCASATALQVLQIAALGAGATALQLPRRNFLGATAATVAAPRIAAAAELEIPSAVAPSWTLLIPIVELDAAVARWTVDVGAKSTSSVASALELLNKGGILSSKNFYLGVGTKYATSLVYDDFDKKLVEQDKNARVSDMVLAARALDAARKTLASEFPSSAAKDLRAASDQLGDFLARAPRKDVEKARNALASLVAADANGDGQVDDAEFYKAGALSTEEQLAATWGVWGTTLFSKDLRPASPDTVLLTIKTPPPVPDYLKRAIARSEY